MSNFLSDKPIEQFTPNSEAMREIGAEERMRMIDVLQTKPRLVPRLVTRAAPTGKSETPTPEAGVVPEVVTVAPEAASPTSRIE
jgi:hypothetical protein